MADNITVKDSADVTRTLAAKDVSSVHYPRHIPVNDSGDQIGYVDDEIAVPAMVTEDIFHYAIHEALGFHGMMHVTSGDVYICFKTPVSSSPFVYFHLLMDMSGEKNVVLEVWEGVTPGAAPTEKVIYNKNRAAVYGGTASAVRAGNALTVSSIDTDDAFSGGTKIYEEFQAKGSGGRDATYELVLEKDTIYGFKVDNIDNADCGLNLTWFEVPESS